ncbi:MAG: Plug domain-containing protein, partial [Ignavibacteriales bacterium]|nr:Plug domain-containing protein [Ignavibacteriales bacterium]
MHHKIHIALYTLCFVAWYSTISCGYAQDNKKNDDTTKVYRYGEVVITATHLPLEGHQPPTSRSVLTHEEIERMNARSLADVLSSAEGIFVKDYGGSSGLKTISQRGLGAEHTLILLNGFRLSEFQNGLVDLGLLLTDDIDRV